MGVEAAPLQYFHARKAEEVVARHVQVVGVKQLFSRLRVNYVVAAALVEHGVCHRRPRLHLGHLAEFGHHGAAFLAFYLVDVDEREAVVFIAEVEVQERGVLPVDHQEQAYKETDEHELHGQQRHLPPPAVLREAAEGRRHGHGVVHLAGQYGVDYEHNDQQSGKEEHAFVGEQGRGRGVEQRLYGAFADVYERGGQHQRQHNMHRSLGHGDAEYAARHGPVALPYGHFLGPRHGVSHHD